MDTTISLAPDVPHLRLTLRRHRFVRGRTLLHAAAAAASGAGILALATWMVPAQVDASAPRPPRAAAPVGTASPLLGGAEVLPFSLSEAQASNAAVPISLLPNPAARPFLLHSSAEDGARSLECLTAAVYYEAASEGEQGEAAVAQVVLNRLRHPAFPKTVCGVVFQGAERTDLACQFTFTCNGAMDRDRSRAAWDAARRVAAAALAGHVEPEVGLATHYHTVNVVPFWRDSLVKVAVVGAHIFYRWSGSAGLPSAFDRRYAGGEERVAALFGEDPAAAATAVPPESVPAAKPAPRLPGLATDLSGMAEVDGAPRIVLPPKEAAVAPGDAQPVAVAVPSPVAG